MAEVHGSCDDRFSGVREAFERGLDGEELGASLAVDLDGETVVDQPLTIVSSVHGVVRSGSR